MRDKVYNPYTFNMLSLINEEVEVHFIDGEVLKGKLTSVRIYDKHFFIENKKKSTWISGIDVKYIKTVNTNARYLINEDVSLAELAERT